MIDILLIASLFTLAVKLLLFVEDDYPKFIYNYFIKRLEKLFSTLYFDKIKFSLPILQDFHSEVAWRQKTLSWLILKPLKCCDCLPAWLTYLFVFYPNNCDSLIFLLISYCISVMISLTVKYF